MPTNWLGRAKVAAQTGLFNAIVTGATPPKIELYTSADVLLVSLPLAGTGAAAGAVSPTTAEITFSPGAPQAAVASGVASYGRLVGADSEVYATPLPVTVGTVPVLVGIVISTADILAGGNVQLLYAVVGV